VLTDNVFVPMSQGEGRGEVGSEGQEYCLVQQRTAVPNPNDPSYSYLEEVCMCMHECTLHLYSVKTHNSLNNLL